MEVINLLRGHNAMEYAVVIVASAADGAPMIYSPRTPDARSLIIDVREASDTLCIYDDLSKHAVAYRQLDSYSPASAGREAYPGDIFYLH